LATRKKKKTIKTTLTFTPKLLEALEPKARRTFGDRQGYVSMYVEMVLRNHFGMDQEGVEET